jgi:Mce-associated membrane protein
VGNGEPGRAGGTFLSVLLGLLVIGLVVGVVVQLRDRSVDPAEPLRPADLGSSGSPVAGTEAEADDRAVQAVVVARAVVEAFYGLNHRTVGADVEEVRALATGDFAAQYDAAAERLERRFRAQRLVTTPTLPPEGTATASLTTARAEVLVAVDVVRRAPGRATDRTGHRTRVELVRVDDAWLVAGLEEVT